MAEPPRIQRFIRRSELPRYVGLKRTQIAELVKAGQFPKPVPITDTGRAIAWLEDEILQWQAKRIEQRAATPERKRPPFAASGKRRKHGGRERHEPKLKVRGGK